MASLLRFERLRGYLAHGDWLLHARNMEAQEDGRGILRKQCCCQFFFLLHLGQVTKMGDTRAQESNAALMSALSGRYAAVLERIPVSVPHPVHEPQPQSVEDELLSTVSQVSPGHDFRDSNNSPAAQRLHAQENGAEDAARELEESVLGPSTPSTSTTKTPDTKRPPYLASDASSSDLDIPIARDQGRANKKRKVGKDFDITAVLERSIAEDQRSVASGQDVPRLSASTKGKGKGKGKS